MITSKIDGLDLIQLIEKPRRQLHITHLNTWWRGQPRYEWGLTPKVYRCNRDRDYEINSSWHFRRQAPARYPDCPANELDWLFLMQHYRLPTRLLDWTESPLVALFFAVSETEYSSEPAALWALEPYQLNEHQTGEPNIPVCIGDEPDPGPLAKAAFKNIKADEDPDEIRDKIIALYPPHTDMRMIVQQACCTIHGTREPLDEVDKNKKFLSKIEIPASQKKPLMHAFELLHISNSNLFPDLEHLAKDVASQIYDRRRTSIPNQARDI